MLIFLGREYLYNQNAKILSWRREIRPSSAWQRANKCEARHFEQLGSANNPQWYHKKPIKLICSWHVAHKTDANLIIYGLRMWMLKAGDYCGHKIISEAAVVVFLWTVAPLYSTCRRSGLNQRSFQQIPLYKLCLSTCLRGWNVGAVVTSLYIER